MNYLVRPNRLEIMILILLLILLWPSMRHGYLFQALRIKISRHLFIISRLIVVPCFNFSFWQKSASIIIIHLLLIIIVRDQILLINFQSTKNVCGTALWGLTYYYRVPLLRFGMLLLFEIFCQVVIALSLLEVFLIKAIPRDGTPVSSHIWLFTVF